MKKYCIIIVDFMIEIEAKDKKDAKNKFFQMIESKPQQILDSSIKIII